MKWIFSLFLIQCTKLFAQSATRTRNYAVECHASKGTKKKKNVQVTDY